MEQEHSTWLLIEMLEGHHLKDEATCNNLVKAEKSGAEALAHFLSFTEKEIVEHLKVADPELKLKLVKEDLIQSCLPALSLSLSLSLTHSPALTHTHPTPYYNQDHTTPNTTPHDTLTLSSTHILLHSQPLAHTHTHSHSITLTHIQPLTLATWSLTLSLACKHTFFSLSFLFSRAVALVLMHMRKRERVCVCVCACVRVKR